MFAFEFKIKNSKNFGKNSHDSHGPLLFLRLWVVGFRYVVIKKHTIMIFKFIKKRLMNLNTEMFIPCNLSLYRGAQAINILLMFSSLDGYRSLRQKLCYTAAPRILIFVAWHLAVCVALFLVNA